mmetsp:Transcript_21120/g.58543  ORF Transcript_21120/g.58543 Transcript_21120/m.58543 type:complete len:252 (+) Transcript_21120:124-879(+)
MAGRGTPAEVRRGGARGDGARMVGQVLEDHSALRPVDQGLADPAYGLRWNSTGFHHRRGALALRHGHPARGRPLRADRHVRLPGRHGGGPPGRGLLGDGRQHPLAGARWRRAQHRVSHPQDRQHCGLHCCRGVAGRRQARRIRHAHQAHRAAAARAHQAKPLGPLRSRGTLALAAGPAPHGGRHGAAAPALLGHHGGGPGATVAAVWAREWRALLCRGALALVERLLGWARCILSRTVGRCSARAPTQQWR